MKSKLLKNLAASIFLVVMFVNVGFSQTDTNIKIVKNILKEEIQLQIEGAKSDEGLITIKNDQGEIVRQEEMELNPKTSYYTFKTKEFKPGKYSINIKSKDENISTELIIN